MLGRTISPPAGYGRGDGEEMRESLGRHIPFTHFFAETPKCRTHRAFSALHFPPAARLLDEDETRHYSAAREGPEERPHFILPR